MSETAKPPRTHLVTMIVATALYGAALPFAVTLAIFSPMASDGGVNPGVWTFIVSMMTLPIAIVLALILGWIFFATRLARLMWVAILFPLLWLFPIVWSTFLYK
jgi:ABC-type polysaccharide/polyol phosphate export permease